MQVGCVLIPHFAVKAEGLRRPETAGQPLLVVRSEGSRRTVWDHSPGLTGVRRGMGLQEAVSFAKGARLLDLDLPYLEGQFGEVQDALEQVSPVVEASELGCSYVGLDGLERLYGDNARVAQAVQRAPWEGWGAQVGIGGGKFTAYMSALMSEPGRPFKAPEDGAFLRELSVDYLPVGYRTRARLHDFGLHRLGELALLEVGPLQAQFGREGRLMWELSRGVDVRRVVARRAREEVTERLSFPEPVTTLEGVLLGTEVLVERALLHPELRGRQARLAVLQGYVYQGTPWVRRLSFKESFDRRRVMSRIKASLEGGGVSGPVEELWLTLSELAGEQGRQESIFDEVRDRERLKEAVGRLQTLLGKPAPLFHVREVEPWSRIPERRHALVQYVP